MVEAAKDLVALSCLLLDEEKFDAYLALFSPESRYSIRTYSPELRKDISMLDLDRTELGVLFKNLPKHVRLPGRFLRLANGTVVESTGDDEVSIATSVLVTHTDLEGISRVFAAGRYRDKVMMVDGKPRIGEREVRVDTRQFGPGSHIPL
jgi:3-phenylpropionate/cinnamic acid dioxygenase small subunit